MRSPRPSARLLHPLALALALGACVGTASDSSAPGDEPCADFEVQVETYWSASVRAEVMNQGGELEVEKRAGVVTKMDRISEDWVMMRTAVCKDHFARQLITKQEYAARVRCFDDRLERQRTLATALAGEGELASVEGALDELLAAPPSCDTTQD
ncbi:hypothetical protein ENSA5_37490 [Enhygromyxa salina]|uniref:Lipoprotein n=1 Tax=Enhygromyxa salina TaxID=215803 RepID=A0A2S9XSN7_9BACT|nr:hypothetical protein [Enhygromyxa salina]PRP95879.1 hypothetical protein ENSA5_37490 [Enhygromyxa salina]